MCVCVCVVCVWSHELRATDPLQTENVCLIERSLWKALRAKRWHFVSHCKPLCYHSTAQKTRGTKDLTPGLLNHVNHVSCKFTGSMLDTHGSTFPQLLLPKIDFSYSFLLKRLWTKKQAMKSTQLAAVSNFKSPIRQRDHGNAPLGTLLISMAGVTVSQHDVMHQRISMYSERSTI